MKGWVVYLLLALSVTVAAYSYTVKFAEPTDADRVQKALKGTDKYLSFGSHLVFKCTVPGSDLFPEYVSYYLTPVKLVLPTSERDTTLLLTSIDAKDAGIDTMIAHSSVIWENKDDKYRYLLIHHL